MSSTYAVILQVSTPSLTTLNLDYLEDHGMSDLMCVMVHDPVILDVPYSQSGLPLFLSTLDNSVINGWNQSTVNNPIYETVHPDNFTVCSWALLHGPAFWTNAHHDSNGGTTFVQVKIDEKKWGLFGPIQEDTVSWTNPQLKACTAK
ncbi:hypothetical protein DEU56DRAFT_761859 [Suillus clintonianus]|uniref:uncharacterized protein n=1 Tax=Suillus clintonianus TaxID=1904413 RepID=UPI001B883190|nr:uncharacterized protein DEU56DRAFT_761859 [Suillus clintonianus]KAG2114404.1 hypothetical protein DEU56DRAFT_761859 [Suillus clintonianus]